MAANDARELRFVPAVRAPQSVLGCIRSLALRSGARRRSGATRWREWVWHVLRMWGLGCAVNAWGSCDCAHTQKKALEHRKLIDSLKHD